jgi:hypothetical protein
MIRFVGRRYFAVKRLGYCVCVVVITGGLYYFVSNASWTVFESVNVTPREWVNPEFTLLVLALLISLGTNVMLFRWRRRGGSEGVSDQLAGVVQRNDHGFRQLEASVRGLSDQASEHSEALLKSFLELQGSLDAKDREIERYKAGYDTKILRRFASELIRLDGEFAFYIKEFEKEGLDDTNGIGALADLRKDLREVMETEMGVTELIPEVGQHIREWAGHVSSRYDTRLTDRREAHQTIAEVVAHGWQLKRQDGKLEPIREARVVVFEFPEPGQEQTDEKLSELVGPRTRESEEREPQGGGQFVTRVIVAVMLVFLTFGLIWYLFV